MPVVGFEWNSVKTSPVIDFNKSCCADEKKRLQEHFGETNLKNDNKKMNASYFLKSRLESPHLKD